MTPSSGICRSIVILEWLEATGLAVSALDKWRENLKRWQDGREVALDEVRAALVSLDQSGLGEWVEWGAGLDLDTLATAVTGADLAVRETREQ